MFLKFFCLVVGLAVALDKVENNDKTNVKLTSTEQACEDLFKFWYPEDAEFNESCVSEGCPALTNFSLCPNDINITVLDRVLNTAIGCMRKPLCGILIDQRPSLGLTSTTDDLLPDLDIDGRITIHPDVGFLSNVSNIHLEFLPNYNRPYQLPIEIPMLISNMHHFGFLKMDFKLRTVLPSILGQALSVTFPKIKYDGITEYTALILFNHSLSGANIDVRLLNPTIKMDPMLCGLEMPEGFPSVQSLITLMTKIIAEKWTKSWAKRKSLFLEKYFQSVMDTVSKRC